MLGSTALSPARRSLWPLVIVAAIVAAVAAAYLLRGSLTPGYSAVNTFTSLIEAEGDVDVRYGEGQFAGIRAGAEMMRAPG